MTEATERVELKRTLGLGSACAMILGTIIGSGIFVSPKGVLIEVGSVGLSLLVWGICGILALLGALSYAELGTCIPKSGGPYAYIQEAFGSLPGFLYMWAMVVIVIPTGNAVISLTFGYYVIQPIFPSCDSPYASVLLLAAVAVCLLTFVNGLSVTWAARVQNFFSIVKVVALVIIVCTGIVVLAQGRVENFENAFEGSSKNAGQIALAFYSGMFSFAGWDSVNFLVEELKNPYRNLPLAILISVPLVTLVYVMVNVAYFAVLTPHQILVSDAVAVTFAMEKFGFMSWVMPIFVACSCFGSLNGCIMCIGRVFYAGAREGHLPDALSLINITRFTPLPAVVVLGLATIVMLFIGDVYTLINYATFVEVLSFFMSAAGLLYLRWKQPKLHRPIRVPLVIPIIFLLVCIFLLVLTLIYSPKETGMALIILGSGIPVYLIGVSWTKKPKVITQRLRALTIFVQKLSVSLPEEKEE